MHRDRDDFSFWCPLFTLEAISCFYFDGKTESALVFCWLYFMITTYDWNERKNERKMCDIQCFKCLTLWINVYAIWYLQAFLPIKSIRKALFIQTAHQAASNRTKINSKYVWPFQHTFITSVALIAIHSSWMSIYRSSFM